MSVGQVRRTAHHITLDGDLGLTLYQEPNKPASATGASSAAEGVESGAAQASSTWRDFSGGMGYSVKTDEAPNTYDYGLGVCTRHQGMALPAGEIEELPTAGWGAATGEDVRAAAEFNDSLFLVTAGQKIIQYDNFANGSSFVVYDAGANFNGVSAVVFEGALWVGQLGSSATNGLVKISSGGTLTGYTTHRVGRMVVVYWVIRGVGAYYLVGTNDTADSVQHCATGPDVAANWSSLIRIESVGNIQSLVASNRHVYAAMDDGVRDIDARGYTPNITPYWLQNLSNRSGRGVVFHDGKIVAGHYEGLDAIDVSSGQRQDVPTWIDPAHTLPFEGPVRGVCTALCVERGWLVAALIDSNGDSYIIYGAARERLGIQGRGPYVWHGAEAVYRNQKISWMKVVSMNTSLDADPIPRLWVATQDNDTQLPRLFRQSLPQFGTPYSDYKSGGPMRFQTTDAHLYLGADDGGDTSARKILTNHAIVAENVNPGAGNQIRLSTAADGGTEAEQGTAHTSPRTSFRAPLTAGNLLSHHLEFASQRQVPTVLRALQSRYEVVVDQTLHRHYRVLLGASTQQLGGSRPYGDAIRAFRRLVRLQTSDPVTMVDEMGDRLVVKVQPGSVKWTTVRDETGGGWSRVVDFDVSEIARPAYYDSGFRYDDFEEYG